MTVAIIFILYILNVGTFFVVEIICLKNASFRLWFQEFLDLWDSCHNTPPWEAVSCIRSSSTFKHFYRTTFEAKILLT